MRILLIVLLLCTTVCAQTRKLPPIHTAGSTFGNFIEIGVSDPDVTYEETTDTWSIYYASHLGTQYSGNNNYHGVIRRITQSGDGPIEVGQSPVLGKGSGWDSIRIETPCVISDPGSTDGEYKLYYSGASEFHPGGFPNYNIGMAISDSPNTFFRVPINPIITIQDVFPNAAGGVVADPEVVKVNGVYVMFFSSYAHGPNLEYIYFGISWALSPNGVNWFHLGGLVEGAAQPSIIRTPMQYELYYTKHVGNELQNIPSTFNPTIGVWRNVTNNGGWNEQPNRPFVWRQNEPYENLGILTGVDVVWANNRRNYIYVGMSTVNPPQDFYIPTQGGFTPGTFYLLQAEE